MVIKPPTAEEAAAMAAWANMPPIDRALCEIEAWSIAVLTEAGVSTDIRAWGWYSHNRHRLGEPKKDRVWLAWKTLDACQMARQRLREGYAQLAIEHACEAWRYAFWRDVSARRTQLKRLRDNSRAVHGVPDIAKRIACYDAAFELCGRKEKAKKIAAKQCDCTTRTIERALKKRK